MWPFKKKEENREFKKEVASISSSINTHLKVFKEFKEEMIRRSNVVQ
jgi:hypothetical protein